MIEWKEWNFKIGMRKVAQLYYNKGQWNSGKTIEILKVAHNYEELEKPVVIMTSALDTRDAFGVVSSRIGDGDVKQ